MKLHNILWPMSFVALLAATYLGNRELNEAKTATAKAYIYGKDVGFKDGWIAYSIDAAAMDAFHILADKLDDDDNAASIDRIWAQCIDEARTKESRWLSHTEKERLQVDTVPFWKRHVGPPRRISKSQKETILKKLGKLRKILEGEVTNSDEAEFWRSNPFTNGFTHPFWTNQAIGFSNGIILLNNQRQ